MPSLASAATVEGREGDAVTVCVELNGNATEEMQYAYTLIDGTATAEGNNVCDVYMYYLCCNLY